MWWRALLTTALITYLMCVLLLGGLQKEDMNTLNKFQQYNVNSDNVTFDNSRQECLSKAITYTTGELKPFELLDKNKTIRIPHADSSPITSTAQTDMKYFVELTESINNTITQNKTGDILANDLNLLDNIIRRRTKTDREPIIDYVNQNRERNETAFNTSKRHTSQIKLEELVKAFELFGKSTSTFKIPNTMPMPTSTVNSMIETTKIIKPRTSNKPHLNDENNKGTENNNMQLFNQLLLDLLLKTQTTTTTTTTPTSTSETINFNSISRQIQTFLNMKSQPELIKDSNKDILRLKIDGVEEYNKQFTTTERSFTDNDHKIYIENDNDRLRKNTVKYISQLIGFDDSIKNGYSENAANYNNKNLRSNPDNKKVNNINQVENLNSRIDTNANDYNVKQIITQDIIKNIAEEVKTLVLKDLHKEIVTSTTNIPKTTTEINVTIPPKRAQENKQDLVEAVQTFMELFRELKSAKTSSPIPKTYQTNAITAPINAQQAYTETVKVIIPPIVSLQNPYNMHHEIVPLLYNQHPVTPIPLELLPVDKDSMNRVKLYNDFNRKNRQHVPAITIQTNFNEIPPLGISVPNSLNPINQNIIVTTINPFAIFKEKYDDVRNRNFNNFNEDNDYDERKRYIDYAKTLRSNERNSNNNYQAASIDEDKVKSHVRENFYFNRNTNRNDELRSYKRDQTNKHRSHTAYNNEAQSYSPYNMAKKERKQFKNEKIRNFHERLEKIDEIQQNSREYEENRNYYKIPERQQRPVKGIEYSKYDDTHFQDFLKTQQKVTDMLERILATKTDEPRSVEVP